MWEGSRRTTKERNVSETTSTSSNGSGRFSADFDYYSEANSTRTIEMDHSSMLSFSDSDSDDTSKTATRRGNSQKPKCFSKNAILARRNRIKKKKYLEDLENEVKSLRAENATLRVNVEGYSTDMEVVRKENRYLRNVLASRREISRLLGVIHDKTGLLTTSSLCKTEVLANRDNNHKTQSTSSVSNTVQSVVPSLAVLPQTDPDIFVESEPYESPITLNDISLSGPECGDESLLPLNLFSSDDHDYLNFDTDIPEDWLVGDEELPNIGVCLHVAKKKVSLEFCQHCNENASRCWDGIAA